MLKRENLLQYNTKKQSNRVTLVLTYSKAPPDIHRILRKHIRKNENVFKEIPSVSYKRNKNIKDVLVHRKHSMTEKTDIKDVGKIAHSAIFNRIVKNSGHRGTNLQHSW